MQKNEQMEEVQREAKACKSCTPFTKLDIPNIWKKEISLLLSLLDKIMVKCTSSLHVL